MEKLTKLLTDFETLMLEGNPDSTAINAHLSNWRKVMPDIQNHADLLIRPEVADTIYRRYTEIGEKTAPEHKKFFKAVFADALAYFLLTADYQHCPYFNQQCCSVNLPFESWDEELNAIRDVRGWPPHYVEPEYYQRCSTCRKDCTHRIIKPEENGPYWRRSEYEQMNNPTAQPDKTRQQKAADTKKEGATGDIEDTLRKLCEKMLAGSMVKKADDGINYKLLNNNQLYAYIAWRVTQESNLDNIPWKAIIPILAPPGKADYKAYASKYKNGKKPPQGAGRIDMYLREIKYSKR